MDARPGTDAAYHRPIASDHAASDGPARPPIRLFLADVDGTLVTQDKILTDDAVAAVRPLRQAGVLFALTSGRPPTRHGDAGRAPSASTRRSRPSTAA